MNTQQHIQAFLNSPTRENFNNIKNYELCLVYDILENKNVLLKFFKFREWKSFLLGAAGDQEKINLALENLLKLAKTYEEWEFIYHNSIGDLEKKAFLEMRNLLGFII